MNSRATVYLLAFPIGLMGVVQGGFALLSLIVFHDHQEVPFLEPSVAMMVTSVMLFASARGTDNTKIGFRDALLFATSTWIICGILGGVPIILTTGVSFTDGVFESISALTTTGATILTGLDDMPRSFLLYRQFLQWLGGLGVVIFVVAVLPMLNVGGMRLLKAETPGPIKDDKLSPRIANTAHYLWLVYVTITLMCTVSYYAAGMTAYDALAHSLSTVSTGGFSTHDASMGFFDSSLILAIANVFMVLGAISFAMHFRVGRASAPRLYWQDEETRSFLLIVLCMGLLITLLLLATQQYEDVVTAFSDGVFMLISFITSTGFGVPGFTDWPQEIALLLVIAGYLGGCAGSTAGGNKIIRNILSAKLILIEMRRLIHPSGVFSLKYQGRTVEPSVLSATLAFMAITAISTLCIAIALMITGLDFWSAFTAVAACLNVLGPAFGELGNNFQPVSDAGTWMLSGAMILGRLEYFTVLALLLPGFWTR
ncbi:potassium transporter [Aestuariicella hydrocarbonica]|uniref:Trk system potassium uptake protein n=1 Tax=Pseudomaricurvus hydrocarbonicus TaxID=1470433 RepID=A0A9E5JQL5_9GAMM|nr:potassium transporter [Aestuariicella hydrocarbonica]